MPSKLITSTTVHLTKEDNDFLEDAKWKHRLSKSDVLREGIRLMAAKSVKTTNENGVS